jgi:hypothetical protein
MRPGEFEPAQLVGKRVRFADGDDHIDCWHSQVGLRRGVVLRPAQTLAQKAEMIAAEGELPESWFEDHDDVPRVWVKADPCESMPRGCEVAVELGCLLVLEPSEESG